MGDLGDHNNRAETDRNMSASSKILAREELLRRLRRPVIAVGIIVAIVLLFWLNPSLH